MSHLTAIWLGNVIGAAALAVFQAVAGSLVVGGHLIFDNTNQTNGVYVEGQQVMQVLASGLNFITNGSQTGVVLKAGGTVVDQKIPVTCSATGGLTKYPTCITASPYTSTGVLTGLSLECGGAAMGNWVMSGAFVKSVTAPSGTTTIPNFGTRKTVGSGSFTTMSGSTPLTWNPADLIKISTITSIPTTTNFNCTMLITSHDKFGS